MIEDKGVNDENDENGRPEPVNETEHERRSQKEEKDKEGSQEMLDWYIR